MTQHNKIKIEKVNLFVYGTLRKGHGLNHYLKGFDYLGLAKIKGFYMFTNGYYPMIKKGKNIIIGEVYQIPKDHPQLKVLDSIESQYTRTKIKAKLNNKIVEVETYIYNYDVKGLKYIKSGDWNNYTQRNIFNKLIGFFGF